MPLEKDKREEFIISKSLERIINLKKRIDRLVFLYISVIVFGIVNFSCFKEINILGLTIPENWMYHVGLVVTLTILFGLIGSHLIEYVVKRNALDNLLIKNEFFEANNQYGVSKTIIPSSIYEYMYSWDIYDDVRKDPLRKISVGVLFTCFFIGHGLSISHLLLPYMHISLNIILSIAVFVGLGYLYREFLNSVGRVRLELKRILTNMVFILGGVILVSYIALLIWYIDLGPCC